MKRDHIAIFVTCGTAREARKVAQTLVKKRLVACASILGKVESHFRWKGKVERASEVLLVLKTYRKNFGRVEREVKRLHSYEVPEIVGLPIVVGSKEYLGWIDESVA